jgi:MFS transporter, ACS family, glucarate transporter
MAEAIASAPYVVAERKTRVRLGILGIILFLSTVAYADRSILSISGSGIKDAFGLSTVQLGYILSGLRHRSDPGRPDP